MTPLPPDLSRIVDARRLSTGEPDSAEARHAAAIGALERMRRGIYREPLPALGTLTDPGERRAEQHRRFLEEAAAVGMTRRGPIVFAGETAAGIHGFPILGGPPSRVEILEPLGSKRRNAPRMTIHADAFRDEDVQPWGEFFVTAPARTLADLAKWASRAKSISALDFAFNGGRARPEQRSTPPEVEAALEASAAHHRRAAAQAALAFASPLAGSVGESVSRVIVDAFGFPAPRLQVRHPAPPGLGKWFFTDFEWPEFHLVGEFDGRVKYLDPAMLGARDAAQVVIAEKRREDALRSQGFRVVRWTWEHLVEPLLLRDLLVASGLPARRARRALARLW
ncbi:MAG: endonuclease domain-containing protein [Microbacteriaceae bacterium]|nr:endonuclease domain-containing protein [Microbacteriaceae bacterium]MCL2796364.1 endonuclease domain-containing protein [Microbacteriaceae bacterium]